MCIHKFSHITRVHKLCVHVRWQRSTVLEQACACLLSCVCTRACATHALYARALQVLSTFPDMPAISFGLADAKAAPLATAAAGLEGLQASQLMFFGGGTGQPSHVPVASAGDDKLQFEWAWLKGYATQAGCAAKVPAAAAHGKQELQ